MRLIPAMDLKDGRCVRLLRGEFSAETRYPEEPLALAAHYRSLGADWLHVVDLDGARDGRGANRALIGALAGAARLALQVGGGVRDRETVRELLDLGAARVVVGSLALRAPRDVAGWLTTFGPERVVLAFDVRLDEAQVPRVATDGWTRQSTVSLWEALAPYAGLGLAHVLCTDVDRDGTLGGANVALYAEAVRREPRIAWQASGGVRDAADLHALAATGAAAAVSGKALLERRITREELQPFLPNA